MSMLATLAWVTCAAGLAGAVGAWWVSGRGRLDPVEQRRLHRVATPRGGGLGIAVALLVAACWLAAQGQVAGWYGVAALLLVAGAGALEDGPGLAARWRLLAQLLGAGLLVAGHAAQLPAWSWLPLVVGIAGWVNLVNFVDGANGLIGIQAVLAGLAWGLGWPLAGLAPLALVLAGSSLGFLPLNFPRARVFLGDVGSYAIGLVTAWLWLSALAEPGASGFWFGLIGSLPILLDGGWTLLTRIVRGRRWYSAHREHLYQWLVRLGISHARISLAWGALALLLWLGAMATPASALPQLAVAGAAAGSLCWWLLRARLPHWHRRRQRQAASCNRNP